MASQLYTAIPNDVITSARWNNEFANLYNNVLFNSLIASGTTTARTVTARFGDTLNVKDFGAIGDGATTDTAAFVAAAAVGRDVFVPAGTYIVGSFTVSGVKFFGPGTLKWLASNSGTWITVNSGGSFEGLTFNGNSASQTNSNPTGISVLTSSSSRFVNCNFTAFKKYIIKTDEDNLSKNGQIQGCRFYDSGTMANSNPVNICSSGWVIANNQFLGTWTFDAHMIRVGNFTASTTPVKNTVISGNYFTNNSTPSATVVGVVLELYAQNTAITGNTFEFLTQAVKMETSGSTVLHTTISGNTMRSLGASNVAMNLQGDYVNFSNNVLKDVAGPVTVGDHAVVADNVMQNVGGSANASIEQISTFDDVVVSGNLILEAPFYGISVAGTHASVIGNRIVDAVERGINVSAPSSGTGEHQISNNYIEAVGTYGIIVNSNVANSSFVGNFVKTATTAKYSFTNTGNGLTNVFDFPSNGGNDGKTLPLTIASGAIAIGWSDTVIVADTEGGGATDDLDTITGGRVGQVITIFGTSAARVVTVKDGTNIKSVGDMALDSVQDNITLMYYNSAWHELARSNNA